MKNQKFRVWDKEEKRMLIGGADDVIVIDMEGLIYYKGEFKPEYQDRFILMFWTGLKDKNGKEIFEGDIQTDDENIIYLIAWNNEFANFGIQTEEDVSDLKIPFGGVKIIGNKFENPELLDAKRGKGE